MAPPAPTGTLVLNEPGPFHYGDTLTFTSTSAHLGSGHPMVEVAGYQDLDGDGEVTLDLFGADLGFVTLNHPESPVVLGGGFALDPSQPAKFRARLLNYGWKGKEEYIIPLASLEFDVEP